MPLEQIGASLQLLHGSAGGGSGSRAYRGDGHGGNVDGSSPTTASYDVGHRMRESDQYSDAYGGEEELTAWTPGTPMLGADDERRVRSRRPMPQQEDMALLKLGGVGGVQRSGSARYARRISKDSSSGEEDDDDVSEEGNEGTDVSALDTPELKEYVSRSVRPGDDNDVTINYSPRRRARPLASSVSSPHFAPASPSSSSASASQTDLKARIDALTLTAAAQARSDNVQDTNPAFVPPEPRRHTGSFALRSRSALSQTLGSSALNFGNGQGRAAARKEAASKIIVNNKRASEQSDIETPRALTKQIDFSVDPQATTTAIQDQLSDRGIRSAGVSPRTRTIDLAMSPVKASTFAEDGGMSLLITKGLSPIALASPDAECFDESHRTDLTSGSLEGSSSSNLLPGSRSPSLTQTSEEPEEVAFSPLLGRDLEAASPSPSHLGVFNASRPAGLEGSILSRPSLLRSSTSLAGSGMNVLRTPTTEEWSRYLIKQGVDPTHLGSIVQEGARSRSNTTRSAHGAARRRTSERETTLPVSTSRSSVNSDIDLPPSSSTEDVIRSGRPSSSLVNVDDLESVDEEKLDGDPTQRALRRTSDGSCGSDEGSSDGLEDHMRALHEAISRPPSRIGTPAPSESGQEKLSGSVEGLRQLNDVRRARWPSRETAAVLMNYPLPPLGEQRSINDFVIVNDIGRGAYGLVKKAQVKDEMTGKGVGPEFCIKYIIKSRILADCWRRHKVLGPIPVEIHVLDQLRRLPCRLPSQHRPWSPEALYGLPSTFTAAIKDDEDHVVSVGHPALCMMVDFFEDHEFYYMVMPCFGPGQDLFDYIESQPHGLSAKQVRCIFGQLADGLEFLHRNNIVHRDVKDENVILDGKGFIQLIDFGSAAHVNVRNGGRLFDTFSGTLDYAAAEILRGEKYGGKEQDVWALGVVGYVLLCGDCPFWNGEEAMEALTPESRAFGVLSERCRPFSNDDIADDTTATTTTTTTTPTPTAEKIDARDGFTGLPIECNADETEQDRRQRDLIGQPDGGGKLDDAADLIMQCLQLDPTERPSMEQIRTHRFLSGHQGWSGLCGWHALQQEHNE